MKKSRKQSVNISGKSAGYRIWLLSALLWIFSLGPAAARIVTGGISRVVVDEVEIQVEGGIIRSTSGHTIVVHMLSLSGRVMFSKLFITGHPLLPHDEKSRLSPISFPPGSPQTEAKALSPEPARQISDADSYRRELLPGGLVEPLPEIENFTLKLYNVNPLRVKIKGAKVIPPEPGQDSQPPEAKVDLQVEFAANTRHEIKISSDYPNASSFQFVVLGNSKKGIKTFKKILKKTRKLRPLFFAHCGDLVANGSGKQFQWSWALVNQVRFPFFITPGDDDVQNKGRQIFETWFGPSYYSFNFSDSHFVFVDNSSGNISQQQFQWLINDLSENQDKKIFVFTHMPPFDPRPNLSNRMYHAPNARWFMDIMSHYKVRRVYASHLSGYFRQERQGVTYIITGGGGAKLLKKLDYHHFLAVTVKGDKIVDRLIKIR
ncbi:MAG: metallophosphoesterase family protein [bacterium]